MSAPLLATRGLRTVLGARRRRLGASVPGVQAVDGVDLTIRQGETFGLVGESGCGKTTLGRTILGIQRETEGEVLIEGRTVSGVPPREARRLRSEVQYVHQDPGAALDPWWSIGNTLREALAIAGQPAAGREAQIDSVLDAVGIPLAMKRRYPHELSGGQLRRIGLARILILRPRVVILDEPTSGLDLSVQATVLNFFAETRARFGLTYLFISHDLSVVRLTCERVAIMYLGRLVEVGPVEAIFGGARHPYSQALLAAAPRLSPDPRPAAPAIEGDPPSPADIPAGCRFRNRCHHAAPECAHTDPHLEPVTDEHSVACLRWREIAALLPTEERQPR